jgi:TonB-linked SusC/RagA family outer membrane protein
MLVPFISFGQRSISGTVISGNDQEPLIGVNVLIKGTSDGTITDIDGFYELEMPAGYDSLQFSFIGFTPITLFVGNSTTLDVEMYEASTLIDEIVVIGYGKIKKSDLTGAVGSVKSEELKKVPNANPLQALQGKISGLQVLSANGDPGSTPIVRLRGITTLNDNNPIVVIDGVISEVSAMSLINSNDIESVEVLKDASATSIYGSRGASGVIIITTKKGVVGQKRVSVSIDQGFESVANQIDVMTGREFATYVNEITPGTYNNLDVLPDVNWQDLIFNKNTPITSANLSVSGANETANYYFGLGYFGQQGVLPKSDLNRITAKLNTGFSLTKDLNIGFDLSMALRDKDNAPGVVNSALRSWPISSPFQDDGVTFAEVQGAGNPLAAIEYSNSRTKGLQGIGNLYSTLSFLKHFTAKSSFQFDFGTNQSRSFVPQYFVAPLQQNEMSDLSLGYSNNSRIIWENTLSYDRSFDVHNVSAIVGYSVQDESGEFLSGATENLLRESEDFWYINAGQEDLETVSNNGFRNTLISYLGRINYSYDSRYLFTATFRRDGSSKFGENNKYGNFPSFALGWNVSREEFWPADMIINNLKLRASWGKIGNERIGGNSQYSLISSGVDAVFGTDEAIHSGATYTSGGNPSLRWEETVQTDIGFELGLLNDKFTAEVDYYIKNTEDILVSLEPVGYTGVGSFQSIVFNAATVKNTGLEWSLAYRGNAGQFRYRVGVLGSTISNEVTNIGEDIGADSLLVSGDLGNGQQVSRTAVGRPIGFFYGYNVVGVFQNEGELSSLPRLFGQRVGDLRYEDINGDGKISGDDRTMIGSSIPDLIFGFNAEIGYKSFELSADFQGQVGSDIYNGKQAIRFALLNYEDKFNNRWTGEGSTNEHPIASAGGTNFIPSSYFVEDGSFIRLRSLTLRYEVPPDLLDRFKLSNAQVYVRGTNLFTATAFTGYSPDLGASDATSGVIDRGAYPITKVYSIGLSVSF